MHTFKNLVIQNLTGAQKGKEKVAFELPYVGECQVHKCQVESCAVRKTMVLKSFKCDLGKACCQNHVCRPAARPVSVHHSIVYSL